MLTTRYFALLLILVNFFSAAAETDFVFGKHGLKHNVITIESQTDLESFVTTTNVVSGAMKWDLDAKTGSAKLSVPVRSLWTGIKDRDGHLYGDKWLDAAKFPVIIFETTGVKAQDGDKYEVQGNFTMKGVTKPISTVATVKFLPYRPEFDVVHMPHGDLVRISATFDLKLGDFNITSPAIPATVADKLVVKLALTGVHEK